MRGSQPQRDPAGACPSALGENHALDCIVRLVCSQRHSKVRRPPDPEPVVLVGSPSPPSAANPGIPQNGCPVVSVALCQLGKDGLP